MIDQSAQRHVLPLAPRAVVAAALVRGAREMLGQACEMVEAAGAEVAAVEGAVPGCGGGGGCGCGWGARRGPGDKCGGEDVGGVDGAAVLGNFRSVDAGGAGRGFEVQADAGEVGEFGGAPGAFDVFADMDGGFEVLGAGAVSWEG